MSAEIRFFTGARIERAAIQVVDPARFCADNLALGEVAQATVRYWSLSQLGPLHLTRGEDTAASTIVTRLRDGFGRAPDMLRQRASARAGELGRQLARDLSHEVA